MYLFRSFFWRFVRSTPLYCFKCRLILCGIKRKISIQFKVHIPSEREPTHVGHFLQCEHFVLSIPTSCIPNANPKICVTSLFCIALPVLCPLGMSISCCLSPYCSRWVPKRGFWWNMRLNVINNRVAHSQLICDVSTKATV